jgi:hypothetical protein
MVPLETVLRPICLRLVIDETLTAGSTAERIIIIEEIEGDSIISLDSN